MLRLFHYIHSVVRGDTSHMLIWRGTERGNVKGALRFLFHSFLFHSQSWVRKSKNRRRSTYCLSFSLREGEETTAHSFPLKSLFLLASQVHCEARADAGIRLSLQHFKQSLRNMGRERFQACESMPLKMMLKNWQ